MARASLLFVLLTTSIIVAGAFFARGLTETSARTTDAVMALKVSGGGTCNGDTCTVPRSSVFTLAIDAVTPPTERYIGFQTEVDYSDLLDKGGAYLKRTAAEEIVWPEGVLPLQSDLTVGAVNHGDVTALIPPRPKSTYAGTLVELTMRCSEAESSNEINLVPQGFDNRNGSAYRTPSGIDAAVPAKSSPLTIVCAGEPAPTPTATATPLPFMGDVNCDRSVNSIDALFTLQFHAALLDSLPCQRNADVNGDGRINSIDAALIIQVGFPPCPPEAELCLF